MIKLNGYKNKGNFFNVKSKGIDVKERSKKKKILRIAALGAILFIACGGIFALKKAKSISGSGKEINRNGYILLKEGKSVDVNYFLGEVKTEECINVSSKFVSCPITEVNVKVGDKVKAGDILAKISKDDAEKEIQSMKESNDIALSKKNKVLEQAKNGYDEAIKNNQEESNAEMVTAKKNVEVKKQELDKAQQEYENYQNQYNNGEIGQEVVDSAKTNYEEKQYEYNVAELQVENIRQRLQKAVDDAKKLYDVQQMEVNDSTANDNLQKKIDELDKYDLKAPIDGVIIESRAEIGKSSDGVLFKIQNMDQQMVEIYIKDSDVDKLEVGQSAVIQPMLTGKSAMTGVLTSIEPLTNVISDDNVNLKDKKIGKDASYIGQIAVDEFKDVLADETQVKVQITKDDRDNVFRVPLSDILNEDGKDYLYIAEKQGDEYIVKKVYVTLGNKGNLDVEISGDDIREGLIILNNPQNYQPGLKVKIKK